MPEPDNVTTIESDDCWCEKSDCKTPIPQALVDKLVMGDAHWRMCEETDCHVIAPRDVMFNLFRETWYCPPHALEQLEAAQHERPLDPEERVYFTLLASLQKEREK